MKYRGLQSKTHNYLLRSKHGGRLLQVMVLADAGKVRWDGTVRRWRHVADTARLGECGWSAARLMSRGLAALSDIDGQLGLSPTDAGRAALNAALDRLADAMEAGSAGPETRERQRADIIQRAARGGLCGIGE